MSSTRLHPSGSVAPDDTTTFPDISDDALRLQNDFAISEEYSSPRPSGSFPQQLRAHSISWKDADSGAAPWRSAPRREERKSLSDAFRTVRTRKGSVSQNAQEIASALKAPVSLKLVVLCGCWYTTSILTNASSKAILIAYPKPMTLTVVQFLSVCCWCLFTAALARAYKPVRESIPILKNGIMRPTKDVLVYTLPLTAFQIGGHILNSDAMARIPVSLVHTIKGLSPMFTVFAYRVFFHVHYSTPTYLSLIPLTLGVVMACSASFKVEFLGIVYAFGSALCFVTQNIVSKKLFNDAARAEADKTPSRFKKPDKLNLLFYSSALALVFTGPIWLWSEGFGLITDFLTDASLQLSTRPGRLDHGRLSLEYLFMGAFHFLQSLVAFALLGLVSPVTYSVASLIKRVFVIVFAIIWFGNSMTRIQGFGIALTIFGLYLYDRTSDAARLDKRLAAKQSATDALLPLSSVTPASAHNPMSPVGAVFNQTRLRRNSDLRSSPVASNKREDDGVGRRLSISSSSDARWLPPGTKQEDTWSLNDVTKNANPVSITTR